MVTMSTDTQEWLYRQIVENARDAIIFADREGVIRFWNAGAEAVFGYTAAEAVGQTLDLIIPENLRDRHWAGYRRVMETGVTRYAQDVLAVPGDRKDGARISLEFTIVLIRDAQNAVRGIAAILRDVTARWKREKALKQRLTALEAQVERLESIAKQKQEEAKALSSPSEPFQQS